MSEEQQTQASTPQKNWYARSYKLLLLIPAVLLLFSIIYLINFNAQNGDLILKDVSLTGGTTITVLDESANIEELKEALETQFPDLIVREISDIRTGRQRAFFVETSAEPDEIRTALEGYLGYELDSQNSSTEF